MYDKSDPRSVLAGPKPNSQIGSTATPASYGLFYQDVPVDDDANGRSWYTRGQNLIVNYIDAKPGATFSRIGQVDEYMVVLPDEDTPFEAQANGETIAGPGHQLLIVPPGDSTIHLPSGGRIVRLLTTQSADLVAKCANNTAYAEADPLIPAFKPWPAPPSGFKLRLYNLQKTREPGTVGPIWRCTTIMLNFPPPGGARDITKMSPHSHDDFEQGSLVLGGRFSHHMRWPWGLNKHDWREDEHAEVESPSITIIPAQVIHTSVSTDPGGNRLADVFCPPRLDFSLQTGWIKNADEYPLPEDAAN